LKYKVSVKFIYCHRQRKKNRSSRQFREERSHKSLGWTLSVWMPICYYVITQN